MLGQVSVSAGERRPAFGEYCRYRRRHRRRFFYFFFFFFFSRLLLSSSFHPSLLIRLLLTRRRPAAVPVSRRCDNKVTERVAEVHGKLKFRATNCRRTAVLPDDELSNRARGTWIVLETVLDGDGDGQDEEVY